MAQAHYVLPGYLAANTKILYACSFTSIMSFLGLGPIIFGGNDKIIHFLRTNNLLARSQNCTRQVCIKQQIKLIIIIFFISTAINGIYHINSF